MALVRTFVAINLDTNTRNAGRGLIKALTELTEGGVRWVNPESMHLTVKFLGDVDDRELHQVCRITTDIGNQCEPFSLESKSVGAFPSLQKPTTIWMGVADRSGTLAKIHEQLESLFCEQLGVPAERRAYRPHITLGRTTNRGLRKDELIAFMQSQAETEFGILRVEELVVYSSELTRGGPIYTVLARCPLGPV